MSNKTTPISSLSLEPAPANPAGAESPDVLHWHSDVPGPSSRWWLAVIVSSFIGLPLGWLLSYGAALPFYLGLFFFMLFGLVIGSAAFRIAAPRRPYSSAAIVAGTTILVLTIGGVSLWKEANDFPDDVARRVSMRTRNLGERDVSEFRFEVAREVKAHLSDQYGPGHHWGYVRWVLTSGEIRAGQLTITPQPVSLSAAQIKAGWAFRVAASIALLGFGIASQTLLLRHPTDRPKSTAGGVRV